MTRSRGPGAAHDRRRAEILAAVQRVAADRGLGAVSQSSVAADAGVSAGRVQYYFPTKDALLDAAFDALNTASSDRIVELVGGDLAAASPRVVLETVLTELIPHDETTRAHIQFRQAYTALALHHRGIAAQLAEYYRRLHGTDLADLVRRDQRHGAIDAGVDALTASVRLASLAEGLAYYVLIGVRSPEDARRQVLADVASLYGTGATPTRLDPPSSRPREDAGTPSGGE